jgi:hypothetical protein
MADINGARQIWIVTQTAMKPTLVRNVAGALEPIEPASILRPCAYVGAATDAEVSNGRIALGNQNTSLMAMQPSPEGQPLMEGFLFTRKRQDTISYEWRSRSFHGHWAIQYDSVGPANPHTSEADWRSGSQCSFIIGSTESSNIWCIHRLDTDHLDRRVFILRPIKLPSGLPKPNFLIIEDPLLRQQAEQHWGDLEHAVMGGRVAGSITSAKQVIETFLYSALLREDKIKRENRELDQLLRCLRELLEDKETRRSIPFTDLTYHLAHKVRILHGGNHAGRVVVSGRVVTPEFGMTAAQDAVEVLRSLGAYGSQV